MGESHIRMLQEIVENIHWGRATFAESVRAGAREVAVFELSGNPKARRAYAWNEEGKPLPVVVLHADRVDSPHTAVRLHAATGT